MTQFNSLPAVSIARDAMDGEGTGQVIDSYFIETDTQATKHPWERSSRWQKIRQNPKMFLFYYEMCKCYLSREMTSTQYN